MYAHLSIEALAFLLLSSFYYDPFLKLNRLIHIVAHGRSIKLTLSAT